MSLGLGFELVNGFRFRFRFRDVFSFRFWVGAWVEV